MSIENEIAQTQFLQMGGILARAIAGKMKSGEIAQRYEFKEYPKDIRISEGFHDIEHTTETIKGGTREWTTHEEVFRTITVHSEEEEERVLSGGKTTAQVEEDRQTLIAKCRMHGLIVDTSWSAIRLRRELGEKLDAPEPADPMAKLEAELAGLRRMAAMQAEIDALKAQLKPPTDEVEDMRQQLTALGVTVDKRWGAARLRDELEAATAPGEAVA